MSNFPIHICSLEEVRKADISVYDGIITIEDSSEDNPFRYNIFTQQIEEGGEICEGENSLERYYIKLADSGIKVSKDLAFDCVVQ